MAAEELIVHGAREHNLKDVTVRLPRNALICITGLSGSGKSSLAFDTIYAEGQRRYVESLSAYARQFLQMMEKPDVDSIEGLSPAITLDQKFKHTVEVVVDRLVMKDDLRQRLTQSVETAATLAEGLVGIDVVDGDSMLFSENFACPEHGVSLPELEPRIFSFNSPHGACPRCTGLGAMLEIDPDLLVPDATLSIGEGALVPWSVGGSSFYESVIQEIADRYEIDLDAPWQDLTEEQQNLFLYGTGGDRVYVQYRNRMGRKRSYMLAFEGIVKSLQRRYRETDSSQQRERIEEYMSFRPCPVCNGARLKPEVLAVTVGEKNIHEFT